MIVSVIIPVYNAERFLKKSIESVKNQSYKNIELLLVDDGSTDGSLAICNEYALADNRIRVISQKNSGPAASRNTGLRHATGAFVYFVDADDFIDEKTMETLIEKYNCYQSDLVMGNFSKLINYSEIVKQGVPFVDKVKVLPKADIESYIRHFFKHPSNHLISYCWGRLYKLSTIRNNNIFFNEDMRLFEDFVFNLKYLKYTNEIVFVNEALYTYTMHGIHVSASMATVNGESLLHDMNIFKTKAIEFFQPLDIRREIGHALIHYVIIFFVRSCRQITERNRGAIRNEINKVVNAPILRESLGYYSPSKGNSRVLPLLMRFKLIGLMMLVCRYKSYKRYGKYLRQNQR